MAVFNSFSSEILTGRKDIIRGMRLPGSNNHHDYMALIHSLPDYDNPALFGLPENIERSLQRANSASVIAALRALGVASGTSERYDREKWRASLGPMLEMWDKVGATPSFYLSLFLWLFTLLFACGELTDGEPIGRPWAE